MFHYHLLSYTLVISWLMAGGEGFLDTRKYSIFKLLDCQPYRLMLLDCQNIILQRLPTLWPGLRGEWRRGQILLLCYLCGGEKLIVLQLQLQFTRGIMLCETLKWRWIFDLVLRIFRSFFGPKTFFLDSIILPPKKFEDLILSNIPPTNTTGSFSTSSILSTNRRITGLHP